MKPTDILTTQEACKSLRITRQTLYAWIKQKKIKPWRKRSGRSTYFFLKAEIKRVKGKKFK